MPTKEWRAKNPDRQKELARTARARRWDRIKNDPELKAKANERTRLWYSKPENRERALFRKKQLWQEQDDASRRALQCRALRRLYGITLEEKERMVASQGGKCAICDASESQDGKWHLDHDHKTGLVRGALCMLCNLMLGKARDDSKILRAAAAYLDEAKR